MGEDNYIFGKKLGDMMVSASQMFILRAMMSSLFFLILSDLAGGIYAVFFTNIDLTLKILSGVSGLFGAILLSGILITTFQQYKTIIELENVQKMMAENVQELNQEMEVKNG